MHSSSNVVCSANTSAALRATFMLSTAVDGLPTWPPYGHRRLTATMNPDSSAEQSSDRSPPQLSITAATTCLVGLRRSLAGSRGPDRARIRCPCRRGSRASHRFSAPARVRSGRRTARSGDADRGDSRGTRARTWVSRPGTSVIPAHVPSFAPSIGKTQYEPGTPSICETRRRILAEIIERYNIRPHRVVQGERPCPSR